MPFAHNSSNHYSTPHISRILIAPSFARFGYVTKCGYTCFSFAALIPMVCYYFAHFIFWYDICDRHKRDLILHHVVSFDNKLINVFITKKWTRCHWSEIIRIAHDDVIIWKHFQRYWSFVRKIHRSPVNSPHKGQWRWALIFSLSCVWTNGWANTREAGDLRRHRAPYDVIIMAFEIPRNLAVLQVLTHNRVVHQATIIGHSRLLYAIESGLLYKS